MNAEWNSRDIKYARIPEIERNIRDMKEIIEMMLKRDIENFAILSKQIKDLDSRLVYLEEENLRRERAEVVSEAVAIEKELQSIENGTYDYEG